MKKETIIRWFFYAAGTVLLFAIFLVCQDGEQIRSRLEELGLWDSGGRDNTCLVDQRDDIMDAFSKALSDSDIIECQRAAVPLFDRAAKEGYFANTQAPDALLTLVADHVLNKRIQSEDPKSWERFNSMEYFMLNIEYCKVIAQTNSIFLKLADYLAAETMIPTTNWTEKVKLAREQDEALIASGVIKRPPIIIGYPSTPNLRALREKYDRIKSWNGKLNNHRLRVASIFSERMTQYLRSLKKEDAEAFRKLFTERAGLSKEEESLFFPKGKEEGK
ncbi:MAG: hypothetical protein IJR99_05555 [Kiritimatiellae bacterium]|nr:hypothetical protein [Kiritimatiellia bacterium]